MSPRLIKPHALAPGATLGVIAPGFAADRSKLEAGEAVLRAAGFGLVRRDDIFERSGYLAGSDARRADEFMELVANPRIDGIVCARGGYGCDRILGALDPLAVRAAAKPLVGFSDITALLLWQRQRAGLIGFHGPVLEEPVDSAAWRHLVALLTGRHALPLRMRGRAIVGGCATGRLIGGSLTLLAASIGTAWEVRTRASILMLEDVGERPYRIDRMLGQLQSAGLLDRLAGVGLGAFADCRDAKYPDAPVEAVLDSYFRPLGVPVIADLAFGHIAGNTAWPMGARATIDADNAELQLLERGVRQP